MTIDYQREQFHPELIDSGVRLIEDARELERPTWRYDGFDAVDFGVEPETLDGEIWSLTWDPPGNHEGIGIRKAPLIGSVVVPDGLTAVWEARLEVVMGDHEHGRLVASANNVAILAPETLLPPWPDLAD